jgi:hypothetical protein
VTSLTCILSCQNNARVLPYENGNGLARDGVISGGGMLQRAQALNDGWCTQALYDCWCTQALNECWCGFRPQPQKNILDSHSRINLAPWKYLIYTNSAQGFLPDKLQNTPKIPVFQSRTPKINRYISCAQSPRRAKNDVFARRYKVCTVYKRCLIVGVHSTMLARAQALNVCVHQ